MEPLHNLPSILSVCREAGPIDYAMPNLPSWLGKLLAQPLAILGEAGSGVAATVATCILQLQAGGIPTAVFDTRGQYAGINQAASDAETLTRLRAAGREPAGVRNTDLFHLVNTKYANPLHPRPSAFSPRFASLSPPQWAEALALSEAEAVYLERAVEAAEMVLAGGAPSSPDHRRARVRVAHVADAIKAILSHLEEKDLSETRFRSVEFQRRAARLPPLIGGLVTGFEELATWHRLSTAIEQLRKSRLLDHRRAETLDSARLLKPGRVSVIDLSEVSQQGIARASIASVLEGVLDAFDSERPPDAGQERPKAVVILDRIEDMIVADDRQNPSLLSGSIYRLMDQGPKASVAVIAASRNPGALPDWLLDATGVFLLHRLSGSEAVQLSGHVRGAEQAADLHVGYVYELAPQSGPAYEISVEPPTCHLPPDL